MEVFGYKSILNAVYDMFALGGAYRSRSNEEKRIATINR